MSTEMPSPKENEENEVNVSPMSNDDVLGAYKISNQDSVRAVSFNPTEIDLASHKEWFADKLADDNTIMLKATIGDSIAGQTRLDIDGDRALIGVSTLEGFRGKGIASKLLQAAIKAAEDRGLKAIDAYIKPDNAASINLFEKNGWIFVGDEMVSGILAHKYILKIK